MTLIHRRGPESVHPPLTAGAAICARRIHSGSALDLVLQAIGNLGASAQGATAEDLKLVRSMSAKGDGSADAVYRLYSERVFRYIYWRVGEQTEDAEDLVLETFMTAMDLAGSFDGRSTVFVWLCGIAKLRMIDHHRRKGRAKRNSAAMPVSLHDLDEDLVSASTSAAELINQISASQLMDAALQMLSADERESLLLLHVDGLSVREIASHMKRSEDAIDALTRRAKAKLRGAILLLIGEEDSVD